MKRFSGRSSRAVTLTELLVVVTIISLLATLAVPVYLTQIQRARVATATAEVRAIAEAQQMVALTHGFFVPIHLLNNLPNPDPGFSSTGFRDDFQPSNLSSGQRRAINASVAITGTIDVINNPVIPTSLSDTDNSRVAQMVRNWQGPFLNPKRVIYPGETATGTTSNRDVDLVVDPWGTPYRFYTERGATGSAQVPSTSGASVLINLNWDDGSIGFQESDRFDRFAIVSYGPNGISDYSGSQNQFRRGDDIEYSFPGIFISESTYRGF